MEQRQAVLLQYFEWWCCFTRSVASGRIFGAWSASKTREHAEIFHRGRIARTGADYLDFRVSGRRGRRAGVRQQRIAPAATRVRARGTAENREGPRGISRRRAPREDDWRAHCHSAGKSRLEKLGEGAAGRRYRWCGGCATETEFAAPGTCGSGRSAEI